MAYDPEYWARHAALVAERTGRTVQEIVYDELDPILRSAQDAGVLKKCGDRNG